MGSITRSLSNNITTSGVILPAGITNDSVSAVTSFANAADPSTLKLLSTQTASSSANISFTTGLDSTYDEYVFKFINIHPSVDDGRFEFNLSTDSGSNYNVTKTTTFFYSYHAEADTSAALDYDIDGDLAQSTGFQRIQFVGNDNDQNFNGSLSLFNPASTTYVKHFLITGNTVLANDISLNVFCAGYGNTTSAVNAVQFKFSSGNIDDGIIKLYGVKKS